MSMLYVHSVLSDEILIVNRATTAAASIDVEAIVAILNAAIGSASREADGSTHLPEAVYSEDTGIDPASTVLHASCRE